jgi:hypothetical protein
MTIIKAQIVDESTGQSLPGAQIYAADAGGNAVAIARADGQGGFSAAVPLSSPSILVVQPGYAPATVDIGDLQETGSIGLTPAVLSQGQATKVIPNSTVSAVPWWAWAGAAGITIYAISGGTSKKKMSGDSGSAYIIPIGLVILAYFVLKNFNLFGPSAQSSNQSSIDTSTAAGAEASLVAAQAAGDIATLTASQAAGLADAIFQAGLAHDAFTVKRQIIQCNTLTDLLLVIQAFGTKKADISSWSPCSTLGIFCQDYNLNAWLHTPFMDSGTLADINTYLSNQGINYQF